MDNIKANCNRLFELKYENGEPYYPAGSRLTDYLRLNDMWYRKQFIYSGQFTSVIGAYFGICIDIIFLGGSPQNTNITHSRLKLFARFLIVAIFLITPWYFIQESFTIKTSNFLGPYSFTNELLARYAVPYFFFNLILFSYMKLLFQKLNLINTKSGRNASQNI